jgi:hypothetical protein
MSKRNKDFEKEYKELETKYLKLHSENVNLKVKATLYESLNDRFSQFKEKVLFVFNFLSYLGLNSCVYGSFVRKLFDFSLRFDEIRNPNVGSLENSDINIVYMNNTTFDKQQTLSNFYKVIDSIVFNKLQHWTQISSCSLPTSQARELNPELIQFNGFTFSDLNYDDNILDKNNHLNPKAILLFRKIIKTKNGEEEISKVLEIKVNMVCFRLNYSPTDSGVPEFTNNIYSLNYNGIFKNYNISNSYMKSFNFYEYLNYLCNNEMEPIKDIRSLQENAFPENSVIPREYKIKWLRQIYEIISTTYIKNLDNSFKLVGEDVPDIKIESKEECQFTGSMAPYPVIKLECNHDISLMAYNGIIEKGYSDNSEAIRCPFCRGDLKIKLININSCELTKNISDMEIPFGTRINTNKQISSMIINKEALKQM